MYESDTSVVDGLVPLGEFVLNVGRGEDWLFVTIDKPITPKSMLDTPLASVNGLC